MTEGPPVRFDDIRLTIEDIVRVAGGAPDVLSDDALFRARIARGADFLDRLLREEGVVYGVTTGYGDSCTVPVPAHLVEELRVNHTLSRLRLGRLL